MYSRSSYCVSTRIFACGFSLRIWIVASMPPRPGMAMSIRMTSGASRRASSTASCPLAASPTTVMSSDIANSARTPSRRIAWSSAIRTRMLLISHLLARPAR